MLCFFIVVTLSLVSVVVVQDCYPCQRTSYCISYSNRCDGKFDCPLGDDENECIPELICPYNSHYRCSDSGDCIEINQVCDDQVDCPGGEDEYENCYKYGKAEASPSFYNKI